MLVRRSAIGLSLSVRSLPAPDFRLGGRIGLWRNPGADKSGWAFPQLGVRRCPM